MTANTGLVLFPGDRTTDAFLERLRSVVNSELNPVKFLAIDPGTSNGVCLYDARYYLVSMMTVHAEDLDEFIEQFEQLDTIICEDYKVYRHKANAHVFSDLQTPRAIGGIESFCRRKKVKLVKQLASNKPTGYAFLGKKPLPKSDPKNHQMDAHVHFIFWAVKNNLIDIKTLLRN